jgi:hypothetical protein
MRAYFTVVTRIYVSDNPVFFKAKVIVIQCYKRL